MRKFLILLAVCGFFGIAKVAFAADGTISGTVTHAADGTAIASLTVFVQNVDTKAFSYPYTDAAGAYSVSLAPGTYDVSPYTSTSAEANVTFIKKTSTITIASGETKSGQNFVLTRRGSFTGHVYAADGVTPINSVSLSFVNASGSTYGFSYPTTVSNGSYTSSPSPSDTTQSAVGTYTLTISKFGYFSAQITGVVLTGDETSITQNVTLTPASTITGTIVDQNGAALAGATVTIAKSSGASLYSGTYTATTNAAGAYTVSIFDISTYNGSAVSDYNVTVSKSGYISKTSTLSITADGTALTGKNYTLTLGKTYSGTVVAKSGNTPLSTAYVYLYKRNKVRSEIPDYTATTNSSGVFSITGIQTGKYRVKVVKNTYVNIVIDSLNIKADISGATHKLELGGTISGSVYTGNHVGIDGASIAIYALKNGKQVSYTSTIADEDGNYTVSGLKAGTYRLKITTTDYVTQLANVTVKTGLTATKNLKLTAAGTIEGYITDKDTGLPVSATIRVVGTSIVTSSDANGYYILDGIAPGKRKISVISYMYDVAGRNNITVKSGKIASGINFTLKPKQ
ncbi:MAG: carboxypeptidase regulatory-like domain-containing protein [Patescibacteria group bacterium]|jgi:protocatechuate 3,4-dioxygenase beta subunit